MPDFAPILTQEDWEEEISRLNDYLVEQDGPVRMRLVPVINYAMVAVETASLSDFDALTDDQKRTYLQQFNTRKPTDPLPEIPGAGA